MFIKKRNLAVFIMMLLLIVAALVACGSKASEEEATEANGKEKIEKSEEIVIQHDLGDTTIPFKPEKIVVLEYSFVDALASLGITPVGIADDGEKDNIIKPIAEQMGDFTSVGTRKQPNLEVISSLKPDLIIADTKRHKGIYEDLTKIAPTIVLPSLAGNYEDNIEAFPVIAKAVGQPDEAEKRLTEHQDNMASFRAKIPADENRTVLPAVVTDTGLFGHSDKSYVGSLFFKLGFEHAITADKAKDLPEYLDSPYLKMNLEQLVEFNPDILFLMKSGDGTVDEEWKQDPLWQSLSAVKNDQVYEVDRNRWAKSRGLISSEIIAEDAINDLFNGTSVE
ncbi:ABC transporter substrate-binding protein [Bacillus sp. 2205SS5-2]|uniref:ABC transporter substrate-binding protein n=1 Tax=Bacillus sp. 2205SS5-2 TaxID=3109031 RepID=UPI003004A2BD